MTKKNPPKNGQLNRYDNDWITLISEAKRYGFSKQEISNFLKENVPVDKITYHESS